MIRIKIYKLFNLAGVASASMFGMLALMFIVPTVTSGANAEDTRTIDSASFGVDINSESVVSIAIDKDDVVANVTPTAAGSFTSQDAKIMVKTNSLDGYKLLMSVNNGRNDQPTLVNTNANVTDTINSTATTLAGNALVANTWGVQSCCWRSHF